MKIKTKIVSCHTAGSKPVKQEVTGTLILPPLVFPVFSDQSVVAQFCHQLFTMIQPQKRKSPNREFTLLAATFFLYKTFWRHCLHFLPISESAFFVGKSADLLGASK
jgi:hypothetical protein